MPGPAASTRTTAAGCSTRPPPSRRPTRLRRHPPYRWTARLRTPEAPTTPGRPRGSCPASGVQGHISPEGDVDWYQFTASAAGWYTVRSRSARRTAGGPGARPRGPQRARATSWPRRPRRHADRAHVPIRSPERSTSRSPSADGAAQPDRTRSRRRAEGTRVHSDGHRRRPTSGPIAVGDVTGDGLRRRRHAPAGGTALRVYAGDRRPGPSRPRPPSRLPSGTLTGGGIAVRRRQRRRSDLDVVAGPRPASGCSRRRPPAN